ncbi:MAG: DUF1552 domain-containing protein [Pirellulaceae bacterium]
MNLSRRTVLQGLGAALALPWMESLAWAAGQEQARPPVRWGCVLFANGVNPDHWWARQNGDQLELSKTLQPLAEFEKQLLVLRELHVFNNTSGPHWPLFTNYLNGAPVRQGLIPDGAESIDQLIAGHVGRHTAVPSLVLGVEPAEHGLRGGVPAVYYATVSWSSKNTPVPPEIYPRAAFDRLFDTTGLLRDRSVLDAVLEQAKSLEGKLGRHDRQKLDAFMHSVRDVEQRIDRATREERLEGWRPTLDKPNIARPGEKPPQDVREHMRLMLDLVLLAFQMDKTRVATLVLNRDVSHMQFGFLDGVGAEQLHSISHHKRKEKTLSDYQRINQFHVEQFAYLLGRMQAIDEGQGTTLLDNSMLMFGSNMFDGDLHDGRNLPLVLAGGGGGALRGGRLLDFTDKSEEEQRMCNLHLALARRMGVEIDKFGDSIHEMPGLG